jgi:hypothetical protein
VARGRQSSRFAHFGRGLNVADGVFGLREGFEDDPQGLGSECRNVLNVVSQHRGNIARRNGCTRLLADSHTFKDLSIIGNGSSSFAVASATNGGLYGISSAYAVTQLVASGLSASAPWTFLRLPTIGAQGPAYGMNGVDTPRETDGTLAGTGNWTATSGSLPNGTLLEYWENTLWVAGGGDRVAVLVRPRRPDLVAGGERHEVRARRRPADHRAASAGRLPAGLQGARHLARLRLRDLGEREVHRERRHAVAAQRGRHPAGHFFLDPKLGVHITDGTTSGASAPRSSRCSTASSTPTCLRRRRPTSTATTT